MPRIKRSNHSQSPADILAGVDFDCTNMSGRIIGSHGLDARYDRGLLSGSDLAAFEVDATAIRYVVRSYDTPIAWKTLSGRWHIVREKFSPTTSKHQSRLYLLPREVEAASASNETFSSIELDVL